VQVVYAVRCFDRRLWGSCRWGVGIAGFLFISLHAAINNAAADECTDATSAYAINDCTKSRYDRSERDLASAYERALGALQTSAQKRKQLQAEQEEWLKVRNDECTAPAGEGGGSGTNAEIWICLSEKNADRTMQLKAMSGG
jgi:uncharacterized protein YecT (DUF1311 family)